MIKPILDENRERLIERAHEPLRTTPSKLTVRLGRYHQELLIRIGILQDQKKTEIIKNALDLYANTLNEELFPELA